MVLGKLAAVGLAVLWIAGWAGPAAAQGSLFDRGRDLLKEFGVTGGGSASLGEAEIADGLRDALKVGTERVVGLLGVRDGFNKRPDVHIPLPGALGRVHRTLERVGLGGLTEDLELRLNRAAEAAVPKAKALFWDSIRTMTIADARAILNGPEDSATQYFRRRMGPPLVRDMRPIVDRELARAGAVRAYDQVMGKYKSIPFVPDAKADLTDHVLDRAVDGLFAYLGREEAAIRRDPAKRTTALLKKVFGGR